MKHIEIAAVSADVAGVRAKTHIGVNLDHFGVSDKGNVNGAASGEGRFHETLPV